MASTILLKRSNTSGNDSYTGQLGEITIDTQARKLRIHDGVQQGGHIVANMDDIQNVIDQVDGLEISNISGLEIALQTITDDISDHEDRISDIETSYIKRDGTVSFTGNVNLGSNRITNVSDPTNNTDAANKRYVDSEISSLGNVFSYEGTIEAGTETSPFDLSNLSNTSAGAYYSVISSGYVTFDGDASFVNVNDAILFSASGGYRIIDNTNTEISGTTDFISVTGSTDLGYTVDISSDFKGRVSTLESSTVQSVSGSGAVDINNSDSQNPIISLSNATTTSDGAMSSGDKSKLDGIESGAQVNTVDTVNGYTGTVTLNKNDIGLGNVDNYSTATEAQAISGSTTSRFMTPQRTRDFIEEGTYTIDGGTF